LAYSKLPKHFHSSSRFRIFFLKEDADKLRVSISKKNFKLAVDRNKIKRQIKETFRKNNLYTPAGCYVVIVFKGYFDVGELTPSVEIVKAVESSHPLMDIKK
jgi:ribonuclease P protein component